MIWYTIVGRYEYHIKATSREAAIKEGARRASYHEPVRGRVVSATAIIQSEFAAGDRPRHTRVTLGSDPRPIPGTGPY